MSKFIEVTDPRGKKILVNTSHIGSVSDVHGEWSVEYAMQHGFKYVPSSCLVVIDAGGYADEWFVLEEYSALAKMLLN